MITIKKTKMKDVQQTFQKTTMIYLTIYLPTAIKIISKTKTVKQNKNLSKLKTVFTLRVLKTHNLQMKKICKPQFQTLKKLKKLMKYKK
jgi:hypothetical protein